MPGPPSRKGLGLGGLGCAWPSEQSKDTTTPHPHRVPAAPRPGSFLKAVIALCVTSRSSLRGAKSSEQG